eukprot:1810452-Rhodomonas_salina.3
MAQPRYRPSAIGVEGQVLVFGGFDGDKILSSCAAFTPVTTDIVVNEKDDDDDHHHHLDATTTDAACIIGAGRC